MPPDELVEQWRDAVTNKNRSMQTRMFKMFYLAGMDFGKMKISMRAFSSNLTEDNEQEGWMTEGQLRKHYGKGSEDMLGIDVLARWGWEGLGVRDW
eukprot:10205056-Alexandrium_andersonii.AAC.1